MFVPLVGQRVFHDVEGQAVLQEDRARHVVARQVVVADAAKDHCSWADAIERLDSYL